MGLVFPIPTTRSSDLLTQHRLLAQVQSDQLDLLNIQTQISTGRRYSRPSEDPQSASRAISLQRLVEEKTQSRTNLATTDSYLAATDSALGNVASLISEMRGLAVSSAQTTISDQQREVNADQVQRAIEQLVDLGNHRFRGRYLFTGSRTTVTPYEYDSNFIRFAGNETKMLSYADTDYLFENNVNGNEVFGAISPEVNGTADLNAVLTENTRLTDLRGGLGIKSGSFVVSDGSTRKTIDISSAETVGDVARLIEASPPNGRTLVVRVTNTGLSVDIDDAGGGNLNISESSGGTTATELGIKNTIGTGVAPLIGADLNPRLALTTRLSDILGTRATGFVSSPGFNNDLQISVVPNGTAYNGVKVQFVDDSLVHSAPSLVAGNETATFYSTATAARAALRFTGFNNNVLLTGNTTGTALNNVRVDVVNAGAIGNSATVNYNSSTKVLTIGIDATNQTTAQTLINAVNAQGTFTANYDLSDPTDGGYAPFAPIQIADARTQFGFTGNSGGAANTLFVNIDVGRTTANHVVTAINDNPVVNLLFSAELDPADTASTVHEGLGLIDVNSTAVLDGGSGEILDQTSGFVIWNGGQTHTIDISPAETMEDLLNLVNKSDARVIASINAAGTGINIRSLLSGSDFSIGENGGNTATQLGVRSLTGSTKLADLNFGTGVDMIAGADFHITRSDGVVLDLDLDPATDFTLDDVLNRLNSAGGITARLATIGNGIQIEDTAGGAGTLSISKEHLSEAAWDLGLIPVGQAQVSASGSPQIITGTDPNRLEVKGVFNSLLRLQNALRHFDLPTIERTSAMLGDDLKRLDFSRAEVGTRLQGLDVLKNRLDDEEVELKTTLSNEVDIDLAQAIANLVARQAALEASLRLTAQVFNLSLLNFL